MLLELSNNQRYRFRHLQILKLFSTKSETFPAVITWQLNLLKFVFLLFSPQISFQISITVVSPVSCFFRFSFLLFRSDFFLFIFRSDFRSIFCFHFCFRYSFLLSLSFTTHLAFHQDISSFFFVLSLFSSFWFPALLVSRSDFFFFFCRCFR